MTSNNGKTIHALWTSGWDSTYMLIQLLREGYTVQPFYVYNPERKSREYEMAAMTQIAKLLPERIKTGKLLPFQSFSRNDIKIDPAIKQAHKNICRQGWFLGTQYILSGEFC